MERTTKKMDRGCTGICETLAWGTMRWKDNEPRTTTRVDVWKFAMVGLTADQILFTSTSSLNGVIIKLQIPAENFEFNE